MENMQLFIRKLLNRGDYVITVGNKKGTETFTISDASESIIIESDAEHTFNELTQNYNYHPSSKKGMRVDRELGIEMLFGLVSDGANILEINHG